MAEYEPAVEALKCLVNSEDIDNETANYLSYFINEYDPGEYNWPGWMQALMIVHCIPMEMHSINIMSFIPTVLFEARNNIKNFNLYIPRGQENDLVSVDNPKLGTWMEYNEHFKIDLQDQIDLLDSWIVDGDDC